jgi:ribokinase
MMGPQGAEAFSTGGWLHVPAPKVKMRDTTGAFDCFVGVFAAGVARGDAMEVALRRAAVAAALSTERLGAQGGMPLAADIDDALRRAPQVTDIQAEVPD